MVTRVGIAVGAPTEPNPLPIPVATVVAARRVAPAWIDVTDPPAVGAPCVLVRTAEGLLQARPTDSAVPPHSHPAPWGDRVRFRPGPPTDDPAAPEGALHIDTTTGRGYRLRRIDTED
ncbi:hypothetical protein [Microcystis phage Mwe-JY05]